MTHIEQMIQDMCPHGVEFKTLGEVEKSGLISMGRGNVISKDDMKNTPGDYPVYSSSSVGNGEIGRYGLYMFDDERITWSIDGGGKFFYRNNHKYSVTNVGGWIKVLREDIITTKFLYYILIKEWTNKVYDYNHKAHPSVIREEYEIPLPPLEIQKKIVECLDKFSALAAELQAELHLRRKQYEYYRTQLLTPHSDCNSADNTDDAQCEWIPLKELIVSLKTGLNPRSNFQLNTPESTIPYITGKDIYGNIINVTSLTDLIDTKARDLINKRACLEGNILLFASTGTGTVGRMAYIEDYNNDWAMSETLYAIKTKETLQPRYLMHCLYSPICRSQFDGKISRGSVPHLKVVDLLNVKIPLLPLNEQARIVNILDKFDKLTTSLEEGIPAEQIRQQRRYEYYRDLLLTFDRKAV